MAHAACILRPKGIAAEKPHDLSLCLQTSGGVAFQRFTDERRKRLIRDEHLASSGRLCVFVPDGRVEDPESILSARLHAALGLFGVVLALVLRNAGDDVLDEQGRGVGFELHDRRLNDAACFVDFVTKQEVAEEIAPQSVRVIDDQVSPAMLAQVCDSIMQTGPVGTFAAHHVLKNLHDGQATTLRELAAGPFLRLETIAALDLL